MQPGCRVGAGNGDPCPRAGVEARIDPARLNQLAAAAGRGDQEALTELLRELHPVLYSIAHARTASRVAAEDVAAEACFEIARGISGYRAEGAVEAWAMGVLRNRLRQWFRTNRRRPETPSGDVPETVATDRTEDEVTARLELERVTRALSRLPERMTAVVVYRVYEGLSSTETAERLGMSEGAVRVALHRALGRLREDLS